MPVEIRPYQKSDRLALADLFRTCQLHHLPGIAPGVVVPFEEATRGEPILTAVENDEPVGFVSWWPPDDFIHNLFVRPDRFRRGIGSLLMKACLSHLNLPARLKCAQGNTRAIAFYQHHGWRLDAPGTGEQGDYFWMVLEALPHSESSYD